MLVLIQHIDESILYFIHITCSSSFLDAWVPLLRNPFFWSPLYLFLFIFMWKNFGIIGLWWCLFFFICFVFCDFISASLFKPLFHRVRPCNDMSLFFTIRDLVTCGNGFSFPSSHASNHVGLATYMIFTLKHKFKYIKILAILWAALVCYAQLYVAVHYPSDILGGALLGLLIGWLMSLYGKKKCGVL